MIPLLLFPLFTALLSPDANAAGGDGVEVVFVQGTVEAAATPDSAFSALKGGQRVGSEHVVRTGAGSTAILAYSDGTRVKLNEASQLVIEKNGGELRSGGVFSQVKPQSPGKRFMIHTQSVTMGVRGTRFFAAFGKAEKGATPAAGADLWMCVEEGEVGVETADHKPVAVKAGFGVFVHQGSEIEPPAKFEWTKKLNWNLDPGAGDVMDRTPMDMRYREPLKQNYD